MINHVFSYKNFLLLDQLAYLDSRCQSAILFIHSSRKNIQIYTFPKGISAKEKKQKVPRKNN